MTNQTQKPADFNDYWDNVDADLAQYPARPELMPLDIRSTDFCTVYALRLTSVGPYRIFGYYSVPHGDGPFPALMRTPGYGSVNHVPDYYDRMRYVCLTLMHRGQRLADQPYAATYPGLLTEDIDDPSSYIYRGVVADCLRGAEFLASRSEVDSNRIAVVGNDLALITAARRPEFKEVQAGGLLFYRLMDAAERSEAYPVEEINDYLRGQPDQKDAVKKTLSYFDPTHHASRITARTTFSVGDAGSMSGPEWLQPLTDQVPDDRKAYYEITHAGGTDNDNLSAMLAEQLGTEPMSRFRRVY